ncbi:MAG: hypothetical protein JWO95_1247 [Verrucomicrobiales bacterium]|nr:hypothetical protein [Verrucomicrobiales bacterium]
MMQMRYAFFCAFVVAALVFASGCSRKATIFSHEPEPDITGSPSDPAVELKCELQPDHRYAFHLETDNSYTSSKWKFGMGSQETHFETDYRLMVTNETSKAHKQLDIEYLALVLQVFSGDESKLYFDSENRAVPMTGDFAETMRSLIHGHFGAELARRGTLSKVYGLDELVAAATAKKNLRRVDGSVRRLASTQTVRQMVEFNKLPEKSVHVGDTWHQTNDLSNGLQSDATFTFRGWQWHDSRKCALIEFEGPITTQSAKNKSAVEDGKYYGRYWFDPELSLIVDSVVHEQYTWNRAKGPDGEKLPMSQTVSVNLDSVSTLPKPVATN